MIVAKTYLAKDQYGGKGLFAAEDIKKGDVIWVWDETVTKIYTLAQYKSITDRNLPFGKKLKIHAYPSQMEINGVETDVMLYDMDNGSYINHSERPNKGFIADDDVNHPDFYRADDVCVALRDIKKGEEITCNYLEFTFEPAKIAHLETSLDFLLKNQSLSSAKNVA